MRRPGLRFHGQPVPARPWRAFPGEEWPPGPGQGFCPAWHLPRPGVGVGAPRGAALCRLPRTHVPAPVRPPPPAAPAGSRVHARTRGRWHRCPGTGHAGGAWSPPARGAAWDGAPVGRRESWQPISPGRTGDGAGLGLRHRGGGVDQALPARPHRPSPRATRQPPAPEPLPEFVSRSRWPVRDTAPRSSASRPAAWAPSRGSFTRGDGPRVHSLQSAR